MKNPRSILITGASSGIGAALARCYAGPGVFFALCGRNRSRLNAVAEECRRLGAEVQAAVIDVTDRESLRAWIEEVDDRHPLDLVIANAGVSMGTARSLDEEELERELFDINVTGVLNTIHPIIPRMRARRSGQIALMSALGGFRGMPTAPAYTGGKAAVKVYGEGLRGSLKKDGIRVSVICPGFVKSRITERIKANMPFILETDKAARIIRQGLARNKARIAFPWQTYWIYATFQILPPAWVDALFSLLLRTAWKEGWRPEPSSTPDAEHRG